jgi:hypothetical protein
MKKTKDNEMRRSYKRSDFVKLERGKFYAEVAKGYVHCAYRTRYCKGFSDFAYRKRGVGRALGINGENVVTHHTPLGPDAR